MLEILSTGRQQQSIVGPFRNNTGLGSRLSGLFTGCSLTETLNVYIYFLGSFGNLASLGSRMNGKWKLDGERFALYRQKRAEAIEVRMLRRHSYSLFLVR